MVGNKKILNATSIRFKDISFKSKLEARLYEVLVEKGIDAKYEETTFTLSSSLRPKVPFYNRTESLGFHSIMSPIPAITYTPDFTFEYNGILVIMEIKGFENDVFPVKRNLFRKLLETYDTPCMFFEIRTKKELLEAIDIIMQESKPVQEIRKLIPFLPEKDISLGYKFLDSRDFESLQELTDSAIKKVRRSKLPTAKPELAERYKDVDTAMLHDLSSHIQDYVSKL